MALLRWLPVLALLILTSPARAGDIETYQRAITLVQTRYLDAHGLDPGFAFSEAAEAAEDAIPWLVVDSGQGKATLRHGERGLLATVTLADHGQGMEALPHALSQLEDAVRAGGELPEDVDLPIELLRGLSRALDRHSVILAKSRLERFDERIKGRLSGIGARIGNNDGQMVIQELFTDGPALLGGLQVGDIVLRIDGLSTVGMSMDQVVRRVRGPVGSQILLTVLRPGQAGRPAEEMELVLTREEVVIPNVSWELRDSGTGVITIDHFSEQTASLMRQALEDLQSQPVPLQGLVLDLRGNSGGSMIQACRTADLFLQDGVVLRTEGADGERVENLLREYRAHPENIEPEVPVVVLMDRQSASASEILAGALSLLDRALLIGEPSHGKGTVQKLYTLRSGDVEERARLKLTVARYRLPGGISIQSGVGLEPDILVHRTVFDGNGVWMPMPGHAAAGDIGFVDERSGWRQLPDGQEPGRPDYLLELAERLVQAATGPTRRDLVEAAEQVIALAQQEEDALLQQTFRYRGLDWRSADESGPTPQVLVQLSTVEPARAGAPVEVRASVENLGPAPLYRVRVHLAAADPELPWSDLVLPVGFLPPGERALGMAVAPVSPRLADREDPVTVTVVADRRPPAALEAELMQVQGRPRPPLAIRARVAPHGEEAWRVELELENRSDVYLVDVRGRLALPEEADLELLDDDAVLPYLRPGETARMDLPLLLADPQPSEIEVELRLESGVYGRLMRLPLVLPTDGRQVFRQPPQVQARVPVASPVGALPVYIDATDDRAIRAVTVWLDRHKVAWRQGQGRKMRIDLPVSLETGTHVVVVDVEDDEGAHTRRAWYVRGMTDGDAAAGSGD